MKKVKRILALGGVVIILGLYIATLVSACMATPASTGLFRASIIATILVPLLIYVLQLIYKWINNETGEK